MSRQQVYDCVISGAGPTGLTLALELTRRGKKVRIFDRSSGPRPPEQSRALGILPPTLTVLEPSGVTQTLIEKGLKIEELRLYQGDSHRFSMIPRYAGGRYPFLLSLQQGLTERILLNALVKLGVEPEWDSQVIGVRENLLLPALIVEKDGESEIVEGRLVAGCDGVHSVVREELSIAFDGDRLPVNFSLADVTLKNPDPPGVGVAIALDDGVMARLPLPNGTVRLISSAPEVAKHGDVAPLLKDVGWTSEFSISFHHASSLQKGKFFLAGDAAHVHSPVGARGMNTGIGDAAWLAYLISQGREDDYESHRLPVARKVISQTREVTRIVANPGPLRPFMLRWIMPLLMRIDFVKKRAARQLLAYDMPFPEWIDRGRY